MRSGSFPFIASLLLAVLCAGGATAEAPVAVSPGHGTKLVQVGDPCPTFSWGAVPGVEAYELVVYRLRGEGQEAEHVLRQELPGSANGWTPSLDRCLERGGRYAWTVRAEAEERVSEWSDPALFQVAAGPSQSEFEAAWQVVKQYLGGADTVQAAEASGSVSPQAASPSAPQAVGPPAPLAPAVGDSDLLVNGAAVVTTATLAGALCSTTEVRFLDLGDGTVLDCKTGKMWLKDASCLGYGPWGDAPIGTSVFELVADLNDTGVGSDFGCTGYIEGTYTDWEVPAMEDLCGQWSGSCSGTDCCMASAGLVDTAFSNPALGNAAGDGRWTADDAFVGVSLAYWSATELTSNPSRAWFVSFFNGDVLDASKVEDLANVWPVRGGQ